MPTGSRVEVVVAFVSGSLALFADAGHMLTDAGALAGSIWAIRLAARPAKGAWTFGFQRAEILSAAINGATLLAVALLVRYESVRHLVNPPKVAGGPVIVVAALGVRGQRRGVVGADEGKPVQPLYSSGRGALRQVPC